MSWEKMKLKELYEVHNGLSKGGKFFGSGYPFLTFSTVFNNYFIPDEITDFVQSTEKEQENYSIKCGDVFVTRTSETSNELGMSCVALKDYPQATYNGFTKRMRPITDKLLPEYVGYYMRLPSFRAGFQAFSTMTTRASLRNEDLLSLQIAVPPIHVQEKIAGILGAYDDLIENNKKQIQLLEEMAQRLYKEWFVDFHFPGYEDVEIVDGVPEGWRVCTLSEVADINCRSMTKNYEHEYIDYIDLGSVKEGRVNGKIRYLLKDAPGRAKRIANDGDIIWGMVRPNLKSYALILNPESTEVYSTGFAIISVREVLPFSYLYETVITDAFVGYLVNCTNGAAYPAVKTIHFENARILVPSSELVQKYHKIVEPMFRKIELLDKQIKCAMDSRNRLLPRLIVGELEV